MRILFCLTYYHPYISGLTVYVVRTAEALAARGHEVKVLCIKHSPKLNNDEVINKVKVIRVTPDVKVNKGFIATQLISKAMQEVRLVDTVVVNLPQTDGFIPGLVAKLFKKKLIAVYHCEIQTENRFIQWLVEIANLLTLSLADKIITYTQDYADNSKLLKYFKNKTEIVYPIIPDFKVDKEWLKKIKEKIGNETIIGVAARLAAEKGIEYLLEAIPDIESAYHKKIKIVIVGPMTPVGEEKYRKKILQLVENYKKSVLFLDSIPADKMGAFYSLLKLLVLPSINATEAFGMVQVEAMRMGVPVVASDLPGVRVPIQRTGMGLIVPPMNSKVLAEAIVKILNNRSAYVNIKSVNKEFINLNTIKFYESQ